MPQAPGPRSPGSALPILAAWAWIRTRCTTKSTYSARPWAGASPSSAAAASFNGSFSLLPFYLCSLTFFKDEIDSLHPPVSQVFLLLSSPAGGPEAPVGSMTCRNPSWLSLQAARHARAHTCSRSGGIGMGYGFLTLSDKILFLLAHSNIESFVATSLLGQLASHIMLLFLNCLKNFFKLIASKI